MNPVHRIALDSRVRAALSSYNTNLNDTIDLAIAIQQIPSPTFDEGERAAFVKSLFEELQLDQIHEDEIHNVFARYAGNNDRNPVVVSAHLDTVFPADTDLTVRFGGQESRGMRIHGPGIADNSLGVAGLITLAQSIKDFNFAAESDIWLVANVCEEGLGNLRGMRAVVDRFGSDATYIVVEGGSYGMIFHEAIGVNRFLIEVQTPGGHSWGDFGTPSAIHILGSLIDRISKLDVPADPKTTFNVGVIEGGTSINAIASKARCQLDLRSADQEHLAGMVDKISRLVAEMNTRPETDISMTKIGERPSGHIPISAPVVQMAAHALGEVGCPQVEFMAGSTDASIPLGLSIPSVCVGLARSGNTHRTDEFLDITNLSQGLGQLLLLTLATAGLVD